MTTKADNKKRKTFDAEEFIASSPPALDQRLEAIREVALKLLSEVESLDYPRLRSHRNLKLHEEVQQFEIDLIRIALDRTGGNQTHAARLLGVRVTTLNAKIKRYGIECAGQRSEPYDSSKENETALSKRLRDILDSPGAPGTTLRGAEELVRPLRSDTVRSFRKLTALEQSKSDLEELLASMQSIRSKAAVRAAFKASPKSLGRAAVKHAGKKDHRRPK